MPNCVSPPELSDAALLRFLDGLADPEVKDHLGLCEHCSQKLRNMERGLREITRRVYRSSCPSSMDITAYHLGDLPEDESAHIRDHLELCADCRQEIVMFNQFLNSTAEREPERENLQRQVEIFIARLLDVGGTPAFASVRGTGDATPYVYQAGNSQITVTIDKMVKTAGRFRLTGLLLGATEGGWTAYLWRSDKVYASNVVGIDGEFSFENIEEGTYTLILDNPESEIHLQDLRV